MQSDLRKDSVPLLQPPPGYGPAAPVPIYQWEAEFVELLALYQARRPQRVLEVGTYHGGTLYHWLRHAQRGATVVSVDNYAAGVDNRRHYDSWRPHSITLWAIEGDSGDAATQLEVRKHGPYDWAFIDAGHYEHEVRRDWQAYGPMCKPGGVCCLHDILPATAEHPEIQVAPVWAEIKGQYHTREIVEDRMAPWGGIGVVYL